MQPRTITFNFVDVVPPEREEGKLYISTKYRTAVHSCFCGCGLKVVTPIRPVKWRLLYDGDTVSLFPSVGNWSFPCRSHYWIKGNHVVPAGNMDDEKIAAGRSRDRGAEDAYYASWQPPSLLSAAKSTADPEPFLPRKRRFWDWLKGRR
jgi:hypothetical protein